MRRGNNLTLFFIMILLMIFMAIVDSYIQPEYLIKSIIKIVLFLVVPTLYSIKNRELSLISFFKVKSAKEFIKSLILALGIYGTIIIAYFVLRSFIDLDNIQNILSNNLNVSERNFIYVALYISFINSLLEEFFFRGFIFLNLNKTMTQWKAYVISAFAFSIYHVAILANWFKPILFIVALVGLFIGGIIFNWLDAKSKNIYNSWLVHMFANFAINTIGLMMYNII